MACSLLINTAEVSATHGLFNVDFYEYAIRVLVTHNSGSVANWISTFATPILTPDMFGRFIVGLSIQWRPNSNFRVENPVATLQLCVGCNCLIFQFLHFYGDIPDELRNFLSNEQYTFVGVGINNYAEKLYRDHRIRVGGRIVDLRTLAAERYQENLFRNFSLEMLASAVLQRPFQQPVEVEWSRWDKRCLTFLQILYASVETFVSSNIGILLRAWDN